MDQKVVFSGRVREGMSVDQVRANFAQVFKVSDATVLDRIFSGAPVVLRKNLSAEQATQVARVLFKAGAVCEIQTAAPATSAAPAALSTGMFAAADLASTVPSRAPAVPTPSPDLSATLHTAAKGPVLALVRERPATPASAPVADPGTSMVDGLSMKEDAEPATGRERAAAKGEGEAEDDVPESHGYQAIPDDPLLERWRPGSDLPRVAEGLAWGGFFAPLVWGAFNGMALSALPLIGVRVLRNVVPAWLWILLYLAFGTFFLFKGRELAWARKNWRDAGHFIKVQKYWNYIGAVLFVLFMWGIGQMMQQQRLDEQIAVAVEALLVAEQQADPDRRASMVAQARKDLLALVEDPVERMELQKAFEEEDAAAAEDAAWEAEMGEYSSTE